MRILLLLAAIPLTGHPCDSSPQGSEGASTESAGPGGGYIGSNPLPDLGQADSGSAQGDFDAGVAPETPCDPYGDSCDSNIVD